MLAVVLLLFMETESKGEVGAEQVPVAVVMLVVVVVVVVAAVLVPVILPVVAGFVEDVVVVEVEVVVVVVVVDIESESFEVEIDSELVLSLKLSNSMGLKSLLGLRPVTIRLEWKNTENTQHTHSRSPESRNNKYLAPKKHKHKHENKAYFRNHN